ncbi:MAG: hypothetical protein WCJ17_04345 [bacterium]
MKVLDRLMVVAIGFLSSCCGLIAMDGGLPEWYPTKVATEKARINPATARFDQLMEAVRTYSEHYDNNAMAVLLAAIQYRKQKEKRYGLGDEIPEHFVGKRMKGNLWRDDVYAVFGEKTLKPNWKKDRKGMRRNQELARVAVSPRSAVSFEADYYTPRADAVHGRGGRGINNFGDAIGVVEK